MPVFLDTRGRSTVAIAICARCSQKFPYDELVSDPNYPGLFVCRDDLDQFDPWRLPARPTDQITLAHARPDVSVSVGPQAIPILQPQAGIMDNSGLIATEDDDPIVIASAVTQLNPSVPWSALSAYGLNAQVTPANPVGLAAAGNLFPLFLCIVPGTSGATAPAWTDTEGTIVTDGTVLWFNTGLYLP